MKKTFLAAVLVLSATSTPSFSGVCEYTPSQMVGSAGTAAVAAGSGTVAGAGAAGTVAKLYAFGHAAGATMLGSAAGGASAAGTVGIMGGTAGTGAAVLGAVLSPFVWVPAAGIAAAVVAYEGGCYLFEAIGGD